MSRREFFRRRNFFKRLRGLKDEAKPPSEKVLKHRTEKRAWLLIKRDLAKKFIATRQQSTPCEVCGRVSPLLPTGIIRRPVRFYSRGRNEAHRLAALVRYGADVATVEACLAVLRPLCSVCKRKGL